MPRPNGFSLEVRERAVRMVVEHAAGHESQWAAITSIAEKIGAVLLRRSVSGCAKPSATRVCGLA
jgi:hypothetical protein